MTPTDIRKQLATIRTQLTLMDAIAPLALDHLTLKVNTIDGYPATASGADVGNGSHGTSESSSTEAAVLTRLATSDRDNQATGAQAIIDELGDYLASTSLGIRHALELVNRHAAGHAHTDRHRLRCKGTGDATGATCGQWACPRPNPDGLGAIIADGRCLDCGPAHDQAEAKKEAEKRMRIETNRRLRRGAA